MALKLGQRVVYTDSQGFTKLAFVTGTRKTVSKDGSVPRPEKGQAHLFIVAPTGKTYHKHNVPLVEEAGEARTFAQL